jgi:tRNA-uridine 2-sulfurtransferase
MKGDSAGGAEEMEPKTVTVALSGGKDSTAAVLLLRRQGYRVRGLHMRLGLRSDEEKAEKVRRLAAALDLPLRVCDFSEVFQRRIVGLFLNEYGAGRTPNPCVACNRHVKFGLLLETVLAEEPAGYLATGHYADRTCRGGRWFLKEPRDLRKSQIYFLAWMNPEALKRVLFPLAGCAVEEVRRLVSGLPLANPKESQDICFLEAGGLGDFLKDRLPQGFRPGNILDKDGKVIGRHEGVLHFTKGQRRGTRFASDRRLYVIATDVQANTVTVGEEELLWSGSVTARDPVYWRRVRKGETLNVKVRYQTPGEEAKIEECSATLIRAVFKKPVRAVTPGQLAVFYNCDRIVASGIIVR